MRETFRPAGYWCYVRPGKDRIGGWEANKPDAQVPLSEFWIARDPITVAQYTPFVKVGCEPNARGWSTPAGWSWMHRGGRAQPWRWDDTSFTGPNQPVIGITWYEAAAFASWLTKQLADKLPDGYIIRLPTEAEWEAAAAFDSKMQRRGYPWGLDAPTTDRAIFDEAGLGRTAPVGICPAGKAAKASTVMVKSIVPTSAAKPLSARGSGKVSSMTSGLASVPRIRSPSNRSGPAPAAGPRAPTGTSS